MAKSNPEDLERSGSQNGHGEPIRESPDEIHAHPGNGHGQGDAPTANQNEVAEQGSNGHGQGDDPAPIKEAESAS